MTIVGLLILAALIYVGYLGIKQNNILLVIIAVVLIIIGFGGYIVL